MTTTTVLPSDIWEEISYKLADHPPSLCLLARTNTNLRKLTQFVIGHYEAHLHITFPKDECCEAEKSSKDKVRFEMILNRKGRYRRGEAHCHSVFTCSAKKLDAAVDDLLELFASELITLRFNNFPEEASGCFNVFNKHCLPKCEDICFNGTLPTSNGVFDVFQSCENASRLVISSPAKDTDFSRFWPLLKGSKIKHLDMMDIESLHHSSLKEFKLPPSLSHLFFCPKKDVECQFAENLSNILYAGCWKRVYIHSESALQSLNSKLYKSLKTIDEFCFSSKAFAVDYVVNFLKKCENVKSFNWYGLHSCVAPIVIARILSTIPRKIVFGGCVACKSGGTVGSEGYVEVANRLDMVQITKLLDREEFREVYGKKLSDAVLFEHPTNSATVMYIQKKDSVCGPNCIDIHEISEKAGLLL